MDNHRKLSSRQHSAEEQLQQQTNRQTAREFASAEEMLRHDALHTPVPPSIASRLAQSLKALDKPAQGRSWWKRLLGS